MPIIPNTYYQNPGVGQVVSNLGLAIFGDPEARAKRDLYGAQTQSYQAEADSRRATADKTRAETRPLVTRADQYDVLPATVASIFAPVAGETPQQHAARIAPFVGQVLQAGGGDAAAMGNGLQDLFSTAYAADGTDAGGRTGLIIGGHTPGKDYAGTAARADQIAAQEAQEDRATKYGVARIDQGAANARNAATIAGENMRFFNTPLNVGEGNTVYIAPTDPRYGKVGGTDGVVRGNPTANTVRGEAGARMLAGDKQPGLAGLFNGSGGVAKPGAAPKPRVVTGKALDDAVGAAAAMVGAAARGANNKVSIDPTFESSFDPGKVAAARQAAGAELAVSGNAQRAGEIYLNTLGVAPGSTFEKPGTISSIFGARPTMAPPAAPAQPAIPPPASRPVGTKARGVDGIERTWNGQAWIGPGRGT